MNKSEAREHVWEELIKVAKPDSRYHFNFNEYIPDFVGSHKATEKLVSTQIYQEAQTIFITPDNCLEGLRAQAVKDGKTQIVSTYGIRRGIVELKPEDVSPGIEQYAVLLDMIEQVGNYISLEQLMGKYKLDLIVTGASAVNKSGVRFGKGHGFFDLEWAIFYELGVVHQNTPIVAFVHDSQYIDVDLELSPYDTLCDYIVTPTKIIHIPNPQKPTAGVIWEKLESGMIDDIPPLRELKELEQQGKLPKKTSS
ncbi:MAG: 5-formyltetrahydrofolate cyclo-ligase [Anaerolineae bacterium]|jgi:5-formyltetrahydrofolate cyclo-ligase|nr:5-formyltetrahydrofolate cyclo-ligase [Anaerolineae bacterium]MBT7073044.1 5-formyltetrahydrofolate cyclo-ligase [Anaerolineae bacterium]MBT7774500.1 5-formyltetrahydrofolate cyclo-ligase [Anaerolineae bacterium]